MEIKQACEIVDFGGDNLLEAVKTLQETRKNRFISIIIPVFNKWFMTYNCILSVLNNVKCDYEIILVDDASTELCYVDFTLLGVKIIKNETNLGYLLSCNKAAKEAKGDFILFLNNDTEIKKGSIEALLSTFQSDVGVVGGMLISIDEIVQEAGGVLFKDGSAMNYGSRENIYQSKFHYLHEVDYVSFACALVRKSLWQEIGGFDEQYAPAFYEDSDFCMAVRKYGYKVLYQPKCIVTHYGGMSCGRDTAVGIKAFQPINKEKFYLKWKEELEKHNLYSLDIFHARDHSQTKKTIVVTDWTVPRFDMNAGSRTVYEYLKIFVELGLNVKFIPINQAPLEKYEDILQQMGIELILVNSDKELKNWIIFNGSKIDYVFANRPQSLNLIKYFKEFTKAKIIYYGHDLHFLRSERENKITHQNSDEYKEQELMIYQLVDVICYPSVIEREIIREKGYEVQIMPPFIYGKPSMIKPFDNRKNLVFVGSNFAPNIDGLHWFLDFIFPKFLEKHPDVKLYAVGHLPHEIVELQNENFICTGYLTDWQLKNLYDKCRLSIVPLRFGAGIKGKIVESIYYGCPVVATDIGWEGLNVVLQKLDFSQQLENTYYNMDLMKYTELLQKTILPSFTKEKAIDVVRSWL